MYIYNLPESPRWRLAKGQKAVSVKDKSRHYKTVFQDLIRLRNSELLAARDMILMYYRLEKEEELRKLASLPWYRRGIYELFSKRRNRRAVSASLIVMFFQQFCGINVLIYYSSYIIQNAKYSASNALLVGSHNFLSSTAEVRQVLTDSQWSMGVGILNCTFAIPAFFLIDRFGRRVCSNPSPFSIK